MKIRRRHLKKASHENLLRLARFIGLRRDLEKMSHRQLSALVYWRLTREEKRARGLTWY